MVITNVTGIAAFAYADSDATGTLVSTPEITTTEPTVVLMFGQLPGQDTTSTPLTPVPNGFYNFYNGAGFSATRYCVADPPVGYVSPPGIYGGAGAPWPKELTAIQTPTISPTVVGSFSATASGAGSMVVPIPDGILVEGDVLLINFTAMANAPMVGLVNGGTDNYGGNAYHLTPLGGTEEASTLSITFESVLSERLVNVGPGFEVTLTLSSGDTNPFAEAWVTGLILRNAQPYLVSGDIVYPNYQSAVCIDGNYPPGPIPGPVTTNNPTTIPSDPTKLLVSLAASTVGGISVADGFTEQVNTGVVGGGSSACASMIPTASGNFNSSWNSPFIPYTNSPPALTNFKNAISLFSLSAYASPAPDRDTASIAIISLIPTSGTGGTAVPPVTNAALKADSTFFAMVYDVMRESTAYSNRFVDVNSAIGEFSCFHTDFHDNIANECGLPPYGTHYASDFSLLFNWTFSEELNVDGNRYANAYTKNRDQVWQPSMWITQSASLRTMTPTNYMVGNDIWAAFPKGMSTTPGPLGVSGNIVGAPYPYYAGVAGNTEPSWATPTGTLPITPTLGAGSGPWPYVLDAVVAVSGALVGFWSQGTPAAGGPVFALPTSDPAYGNDLGKENYTSMVGSVTVLLNGNPLVKGVDWNPGIAGANLPDFIQFSSTFTAQPYDVITVNMNTQVLWVDLGAANITCPQTAPCFQILGGCGNGILMGGYRMLDNQVSDNYMDGIGFAGLDHGQISHSTVLRNSGYGIVDLSLTVFAGLQSNGMSIIDNNSQGNTCEDLDLDPNEPGSPNYDNPEVTKSMITRSGVTTGFYMTVNNEVPAGVINSVNKVFQLAHIPAAGSLVAYEDGLRTTAYTLTETTVATITFITPPAFTVVVDYQY